jgi:diacylglycerol kinase (ATP)
MESLFMENPKTRLPDELLGTDMPILKDSNDKRRIRFIINPSSGVRKKIRMEHIIEQEIDRDLFDFEIVNTEYAGHATELAAEAVKRGFDIVIAVGGDGSVNEVAAGLIGSKTTMGMLPAGSGNGFAMHLGWGRDIASVIRRLGDATTEVVDTCLLNGRPFINLAGVGFEATVAHLIKSDKNRGFKAYFKSSFGSFFNYKYKTYKISVDDDDYIETEALNVTVANAPMYGYNFVVAPLAVYNDGKLEVMVIQKVSVWRYLLNLHRFLNKTLHESSIVNRLSGERVEIVLSEPDFAQFDGEGFAVNQKKLVFTVNPLSLKVLLPKVKM